MNLSNSKYRSEFERLALPNRSNILNEFTFRIDQQQEQTRAAAAAVLTEFAINNGLVDRETMIYGETLRDWAENNTGPLWACKAALLLLISDKWEPQTNTDWAVFSYLFIRIHDNKNLTELIGLAPDNYEVVTLSGWLCAALEAQENYKGRKNATSRIQHNTK